MNRFNKSHWIRPTFRTCLFVVLVGLVFFQQTAFEIAPGYAQEFKEDRHFPVTMDPENLPPAAIMRLGHIGKRTTFMGVYNIRFSPDGTKIAIKGRDHVVRVFDFRNGNKLYEVDGHDDRVKGIEFSPDSQTLATLGFSENESVILWNGEDGKEIKRFPYGGNEMIFSKNGKYIHVMRDNRLDRVQVSDGKVTRLLTWPRQERGIGLSRDGSTVATVTQKSAVRSGMNPVYLNTYQDGRIKRFGISVGLSKATQIEFSPNRNWLLASFDHQRQVYFWEGSRPKQKTELSAHETAIVSMSSSHDNRFFVTTALEGGTFLWDAISKTNIAKLEGHDDSANIVSCEFSPDGNWFATGASGKKDCSMLVWDLKKLVFPGMEREPGEIDNEKLETLWKSLSDAKAKTALESIRDFVVHGERATEHFHDRIMKTTNIVDQTRIEEFISKLNDPKYSIRADATENLLKLRNVAEVKLREELARTQSVEARYRIDKILKTPIEKPKIDVADFRRLQRLMHALELTANEKSIFLLKSLSEGHPHIDIAKEASESLLRAKVTAQTRAAQQAAQ